MSLPPTLPFRDDLAGDARLTTCEALAFAVRSDVEVRLFERVQICAAQDALERLDWVLGAKPSRRVSGFGIAALAAAVLVVSGLRQSMQARFAPFLSSKNAAAPDVLASSNHIQMRELDALADPAQVVEGQVFIGQPASRQEISDLVRASSHAVDVDDGCAIALRVERARPFQTAGLRIARDALVEIVAEFVNSCAYRHGGTSVPRW